MYVYVPGLFVRICVVQAERHEGVGDLSDQVLIDNAAVAFAFDEMEDSPDELRIIVLYGYQDVGVLLR